MSSGGLSCADVRALSASVLTSLPAPSLRPEQEMDMVCTSCKPHPDLARKSGPIGKSHLTCLQHQAHTLEKSLLPRAEKIKINLHDNWT